MLHFEEAESLESKFQRLVDFTDALVGKQEEAERLRLEGDAWSQCVWGGAGSNHLLNTLAWVDTPDMRGTV